MKIKFAGSSIDIVIHRPRIRTLYIMIVEGDSYTVGGLEIETCITVSGPPPREDTAL
jgi:hypothetical protein